MENNYKEVLHYVYHIIHTETQMNYVGVRGCYKHPEPIKDLMKYQSSSHDLDFKQELNESPDNFTYKILDTKPFFFVRILFLDGLRSASDSYRIKFAKYNKKEADLILKIGDTLGPFKLTEFEKPFKYLFLDYYGNYGSTNFKHF